MPDTVPAFTVCTYPCRGLIRGELGPLSIETWHAKKFIDAIKGRPVNKWAEIPVPLGGSKRILEQRNAADAIPWYGEMLRAYLRQPTKAAVLVPIPPSDGLSADNASEWRATMIAQAIAECGLFSSCEVQPAIT